MCSPTSMGRSTSWEMLKGTRAMIGRASCGGLLRGIRSRDIRLLCIECDLLLWLKYSVSYVKYAFSKPLSETPQLSDIDHMVLISHRCSTLTDQCRIGHRCTPSRSPIAAPEFVQRYYIAIPTYEFSHIQPQTYNINFQQEPASPATQAIIKDPL